MDNNVEYQIDDTKSKRSWITDPPWWIVGCLIPLITGILCTLLGWLLALKFSTSPAANTQNYDNEVNITIIISGVVLFGVLWSVLTLIMEKLHRINEIHSSMTKQLAFVSVLSEKVNRSEEEMIQATRRAISVMLQAQIDDDEIALLTNKTVRKRIEMNTTDLDKEHETTRRVLEIRVQALKTLLHKYK